MTDLLLLIGARPEAAEGAPSPFAMFLPIVAILFIYYFILVRPQQKQAQRHRQLVSSLKKGDDVVTDSGLVGSVISVTDEFVVIKAAENVKLKFLKSKVAARTSDAAPEKK
ncbi:MAG: preprotein translocase subunit YajC [Gemmatimonadota bacterium]|nr:MAG: preprotein translocase subunit YajC [Gemmatimonadota bacterium]